MAALFWLTFGLVGALCVARTTGLARVGRRRRERGHARPLSIVHAIARLNVGGAALHVIELAARQRARGHGSSSSPARCRRVRSRWSTSRTISAFRSSDLPALQRELSPVADARRGARAPAHRDAACAPTCSTRTRRRREPRAASRPLLPGAAGRPERPSTRSTATSSRATSARAGSRSSSSVERLLARRTGAIVAVSDEVRDDLVGWASRPREKIAVIPYGFDLSGLQARRHRRAR